MTIKNLRIYKKIPNTISKGTLYIGDISIEGLKEDKERLVRIYLPSNYDTCHTLPVLYMMDGKNLFDRYTSFIDEWGIDEVLETRIKEGKKSYIVVGIDSAKSDIGRVAEMLPSGENLTAVDDLPTEIKASGLILANYIVKELKPTIEEIFKADKEEAYIGGSSMGGLFSFFMGQKYPHIFKGTLAFSPAFCLYEVEKFKKELNQIQNKEHKLYLLVGDVEYENQFVSLTKYTYEFLSTKGYKNLKYVHDLKGEHNEAFWYKYLEDCLTFFEK